MSQKLEVMKLMMGEKQSRQKKKKSREFRIKRKIIICPEIYFNK